MRYKDILIEFFEFAYLHGSFVASEDNFFWQQPIIQRIKISHNFHISANDNFFMSADCSHLMHETFNHKINFTSSVIWTWRKWMMNSHKAFGKSELSCRVNYKLTQFTNGSQSKWFCWSCMINFHPSLKQDITLIKHV